MDLAAAEIVLHLRKQNPRLKLICALPHPGFGQHWGGGWTKRFQRVLAQADFGADDLLQLFLRLLPGPE